MCVLTRYTYLECYQSTSYVQKSQISNTRSRDQHFINYTDTLPDKEQGENIIIIYSNKRENSEGRI